MHQFRAFDPGAVSTVLCDADGNLFPSEEPAFVASAEVTNRFLASLGVPRRFDAEELRLAATGKNFRTTAVELAAAAGVPVEPADLDRWVRDEARAVTAHLGRVLRPDPDVLGPLTAIAGRYRLAAVSSSALGRLAACFTATGLDGLLPPGVRFSAEDSLPVPTSKPDPAVYSFACERLGLRPDLAVAVEDSVPGARSAAAAGIEVIGNLVFVPSAERPERLAALRAAGAALVVERWAELADVLAPVGAGSATQ